MTIYDDEPRQPKGGQGRRQPALAISRSVLTGARRAGVWRYVGPMFKMLNVR